MLLSATLGFTAKLLSTARCACYFFVLKIFLLCSPSRLKNRNKKYGKKFKFANGHFLSFVVNLHLLKRMENFKVFDLAIWGLSRGTKRLN